jgi:hypothetical protein
VYVVTGKGSGTELRWAVTVLELGSNGVRFLGSYDHNQKCCGTERNEDGKMMVSREARTTATVRVLRVGDKFTEADGDWEVVRGPEISEDRTEVTIYVRPFPYYEGQRARGYSYDIDARVNIIRPAIKRTRKVAA